MHPLSNSPRTDHRGGHRAWKPVHTMNVLLFIGVMLQLVQIYRTPVATIATTTSTTTPVIHSGAKEFPAIMPSINSPRDLRTSFGLHQANAVSLQQELARAVGEHENTQIEQQQNQDPEQVQPLLTKRYDLNGWILDQENADQKNFFPFDSEYTDDMEDSPEQLPESELPFQPAEYNYSLPATRTIYTLPTEPRPTNDSNVAAIVLSARYNFDRRQAIRESWAKGHRNVYFVIGGPCHEEDRDRTNPNSTSSRLWQEQTRFGDMLDTIHPESYRGLPYKLHYAIRWIGQTPEMKHIQWVLKVDDDVVVRLHTLQYYVLRQFNPLTPMVIGRLEPHSTPHRTGKWAEDPKMGLETYPPWAYGSTGYVMSRSVIDYVASQESLYYYQGEDVSLGLWLYVSPLDVAWMDAPYFSLQRNLKTQEHNIDHKYSVVIGHDLSVEALNEVFERWKDPKILWNASHANEKGFISSVSMFSEEDETNEEENFMGDDTWYNQDHSRRYLERAWGGSLEGTIGNEQLQ